MKKSIALASCLSLPVLAASLAPAQALSARVLVSSAGTDATGCGLSATSPCRTFQYIINNIIAPGGEIDVLNAGGYGPIVITQSIKIVNERRGESGIEARAPHPLPFSRREKGDQVCPTTGLG